MFNLNGGGGLMQLLQGFGSGPSAGGALGALAGKIGGFGKRRGMSPGALTPAPQAAPALPMQEASAFPKAQFMQPRPRQGFY